MPPPSQPQTGPPGRIQGDPGGIQVGIQGGPGGPRGDPRGPYGDAKLMGIPSLCEPALTTGQTSVEQDANINAFCYVKAAHWRDWGNIGTPQGFLGTIGPFPFSNDRGKPRGGPIPSQNHDDIFFGPHSWANRGGLGLPGPRT